jgi:hypothetical protein
MIPHRYTIRSTDGCCRIVYDAEWSPSHPWCIFINGTARNQCAELHQAMSYCTPSAFAKSAYLILKEFENGQSV